MASQGEINQAMVYLRNGDCNTFKRLPYQKLLENKDVALATINAKCTMHEIFNPLNSYDAAYGGKREYITAFETLSPELKGDKEVALAAVTNEGMTLKFASPELKSDKEVVLASVKQNGSALEFASLELKSDKEVVLSSVKQNGSALEFASLELKSDKEVVLAAVTNKGMALEFASPELLANKEIVLVAVSQNCNVFKYLSDEFKRDPEIVLATLTHSQGEYELRHASDELKKTLLKKSEIDGSFENNYFVHINKQKFIDSLKKLVDSQGSLMKLKGGYKLFKTKKTKKIRETKRKKGKNKKTKTNRFRDKS
jgi:uncharacterized membrane protein YqjE